MTSSNNFFTRHKETLTSLLASIVLNLLKMQLLGGLRGKVIKLLAKEFSEEVVETLEVVTDYKVSKDTYEDTVDETDRNAATDTLNNSW